VVAVVTDWFDELVVAELLENPLVELALLELDDRVAVELLEASALKLTILEVDGNVEELVVVSVDITMDI
jgi:hypothetical protein